jgi:hypothetical protein
MGESGQRDGRKGGVGTKLWRVQLCFIHLNKIKSSLVAWELGWVECNDFFNEPATKVY